MTRAMRADRTGYGQMIAKRHTPQIIIGDTAATMPEELMSTICGNFSHLRRHVMPAGYYKASVM